MSSKFEVFLGKNKQFYFRFKATSGEIILSSDGYTTKANCKNGIKSIKTNSLADIRYERKASKKGPFFNLKARNGQVIGISERYKTDKNLEATIELVKKNAVKAKIIDLTI